MATSEAARLPGHEMPKTRQRLLLAAAREIHIHGFQAASLSRILAQTGVTKGALYHHFAGKLALGYAVLDECYAPALRASWIAPLQGRDKDPVDTMIRILRHAAEQMQDAEVPLGCPVNNLAQEMSPVDPGFRQRIDALLGDWRSAIESAFGKAQRRGSIVSDVDVRCVAAFVVASIQGCVGMAKNAQSRQILMDCGTGLVGYLQSLRTQPREGREKDAHHE